jgi:hypothetical protein
MEEEVVVLGPPIRAEGVGVAGVAAADERHRIARECADDV